MNNPFESQGVSYKQALPPDDWPKIERFLLNLLNIRPKNMTKFLQLERAKNCNGKLFTHRASKRKITPELERAIWQMRREGKLVTDIATLFGVNVCTIYEHCKGVDWRGSAV